MWINFVSHRCGHGLQIRAIVHELFLFTYQDRSGDGSEFVNFTSEQILKNDYLRDDKYTFVGYQFWEKCTNDDYKPNYKPDIT
jgi:hypothetical protein